MGEEIKKDRAPWIVAGILMIAILVCVVFLAAWLLERRRGIDGVDADSLLSDEQITGAPEPTITQEKKTEYELVKTDVEVYRYLGDVYITQKDDRYGMSDLDGNRLVEPQYFKLVYFDQDWVSFEDVRGITFVYDRAGNLLYEYVCEAGKKTTGSGQRFNRAVFYRQGMKIEFDYNESDGYYGIHYYNAATNELIFELTDEMQDIPQGGWEDLLVTSSPDTSGTAVVIGGGGYHNAIYRVTKDGYTKEQYYENDVEVRLFNYSGHDVWNRSNLYNGWLLASMLEQRVELLGISEERTEILYNIHTRERVPLPEEYQERYGVFYQHSAGLYYGISGESYMDYKYNRADYVYYAVCHGSEKLSEEIYRWINFGEKYIIAGNYSFSHILDYEGNVLAEYRDIAFPFVDGRTLVCDETGAYYIDENLEKCTEYIMKKVDYCHPNFIRKGADCYLIKWNETEE